MSFFAEFLVYLCFSGSLVGVKSDFVYLIVVLFTPNS